MSKLFLDIYLRDILHFHRFAMDTYSGISYIKNTIDKIRTRLQIYFDNVVCNMYNTELFSNAGIEMQYLSI